MAPIKTLMETFNKGDVAGAAATHVKTAALTIVDDVPPYLWHGPDAVTAWSTDLAADAKKQGITDQMVTISGGSRRLTVHSARLWCHRTLMSLHAHVGQGFSPAIRSAL